ncbi:MAG: ABC transporter permease [Frankiaceae bacterium]
MNTLIGTWGWLTTAAHYRGTTGVPNRLLEHILISGVSVLLAALIALPLALWLGHIGRGGGLAINISNAGRAIPTFAILVLLATVPSLFGNAGTVIALVVFAIPPILTNAYVGIRGVDPDVKEAATGMGMQGAQLLRRVELPLAMPLIAAGLRTAAVQVVATATLAAYIGAGGLGRYIADGFGLQDQPMILAGSILVALLALVTELGLGRLETRLTPGRRRGPIPGPAPAQIRG